MKVTPASDYAQELIQNMLAKDYIDIKTSRRKIGVTLCDLALGNDFLDIAPKPQSTKGKT
jgi:hypothetical protein